MGLYRFLRRKLCTQQIKEICENMQVKTDQNLNKICISGGGYPGEA